MQTPQGHLVGIVLAVLILVATAVSYALSGGIHVQTWSVDTLYVLDITQRVINGQVPYVDFVLHLGALPFFVMAALEGTGHAFFFAQILFTTVCLATGFSIARTRLNGFATTILLIGITHLGMAISSPFSSEVTLALFYNRWSWALGILFVVCTFLDPIHPTNLRTSAILIGLLAFALLLTKVTVFVAFVPLAFLRFVLLGRWEETLWASAAFLACAVGMVILFGIPFWTGYFEALLWVSGNELRPAPSRRFQSVLSGPDFFWSSLLYVTFLLACVRFRGGGGASLWHFALAGGFLFVQYQNYGNAPVWTLALAVFALTYLGQSVGQGGMIERLIWTSLAVPFLGFAAFTFWPLAAGHVENMRAAAYGGYSPILANREIMGRVVVSPELANPSIDDKGEFDNSDCKYGLGFLGAIRVVAEVITELDGPVFVADATSPHWLVADTSPLLGAAPWNYGATYGIENAQFAVVPTCPLVLNYQEKILESVEEAGITLVPYQEREWAQVYRIEMP